MMSCFFSIGQITAQELNQAKQTQREKKAAEAAEAARAKAAAEASLVALRDEDADDAAASAGAPDEVTMPASKKRKGGEVICGACGRKSSETWNNFIYDGGVSDEVTKK